MHAQQGACEGMVGYGIHQSEEMNSRTCEDILTSLSNGGHASPVMSLRKRAVMQVSMVVYKISH